MANPEVQVSSFGWNFDLRVVDSVGAPIDVSAATTMEFLAKKPSASASMILLAAFITDGIDGRLRHVVATGEIDTVGTWQVQTHVIMPGAELFSSILFFDVKANL